VACDEVLHVVRHAQAGERRGFQGSDELRPLSAAGRRQSEAIAEVLAAETGPLLSSPALRCLETLAPLSRRRRRAIVPLGMLAEGSDPLGAYGVLTGCAAGQGVVACTHGDVFEGLVELAVTRGARLASAPDARKGATASFVLREGRLIEVRFVPPPASL